MQIIFEPQAHKYFLADPKGSRLQIPSVTQALQVIERGFKFVDADTLERARDFGRHVHLATHLFDRGELNEDSLDPELALYLAQYKQALYDTKAQVIASEEIVYNETAGYAGQLDKRWAWKRTSWLCDLKSGIVPRTVGPQTAAYQQAAKERPRKRACLQLRRNDYRLIMLEDLTDYSYFISALNCHRFNQRKIPYGFEETTPAADAGTIPIAPVDLSAAESGNPF